MKLLFNTVQPQVVEDDESVMASFKRLIANIDEIQQVISMSKKLIGKELSLHEL